MKIGKLTLATAIPEDLEGRCRQMKGVSAEEMARLLSGRCIAGMVAAALTPFLAEPPPRGELARAIADAGVDKIRARARRLYAGALRANKGTANEE